MIGQIINMKKMYNSLSDWQILGHKLHEKILEEIDTAFNEADAWGYTNPVQQKIFLRILGASVGPMFEASRFTKGGDPEI
jgi:hypothetical protein